MRVVECGFKNSRTGFVDTLSEPDIGDDGEVRVGEPDALEHGAGGRAVPVPGDGVALESHATRYRATAASFHSTPAPGLSSSATLPSTIRSGCSRIGLNHSAYS